MGQLADARPAARKREREILDAAAEIFERHGYANSSVQQIADAVGLLKGSLYYYIESKEDLLFRVLADVHDGARGIIEQVTKLDAPPIGRLRQYVRCHIEYNASRLTQIAVYHHDGKMLSEDRQAAIHQQRKVYESFLIALIQEAQANREIDPALSPRLLTNGILGAINWIYTWYKPGGTVSPAQLGEVYGSVLAEGVLGIAAPDQAPTI